MTWRTPVIALAILGTVVGITFHQINSSRVLGEQVTLISPVADPTPDIPIPTVTPTATPTATPTVKITPKPTPTPKPQPTFTSEQIYGFTEKYGVLYAVDPNILRHVALCESGFKPEAKNYIYAGLFQFDTQTWRRFRIEMGWDADPDLRYHAEEAVKTGAYALSKGNGKLWPGCFPK